jgi:hypothetical protein
VQRSSFFRSTPFKQCENALFCFIICRLLVHARPFQQTTSMLCLVAILGPRPEPPRACRTRLDSDRSICQARDRRTHYQSGRRTAHLANPTRPTRGVPGRRQLVPAVSASSPAGLRTHANACHCMCTRSPEKDPVTVARSRAGPGRTIGWCRVAQQLVRCRALWLAAEPSSSKAGKASGDLTRVGDPISMYSLHFTGPDEYWN